MRTREELEMRLRGHGMNGIGRCVEMIENLAKRLAKYEKSAEFDRLGLLGMLTYDQMVNSKVLIDEIEEMYKPKVDKAIAGTVKGAAR